jgi:hypothetical protein
MNKESGTYTPITAEGEKVESFQWVTGDRAKSRSIGELAASIRSAAFVAEKMWGSRIALPRGFFDQESVECGKVTLAPCAVAEPGELVRIDDHLLDDMPARLCFEKTLSREIEPFIVGVGEVRVIRKNGFDGLIVVRAVVGDKTGNCHD